MKLSEDKKQTVEDTDRTKIDFEGIDCEFSDLKLGGTIISGHLHNQNNRVTIIRHGSFAVTLERKNGESKD